MCGIYKITNLLNGKLYIGQARDIKKRWNEHIRELNNGIHCNKHLQNAWNKYGKENFKFSIIIECAENDLNELEKYYIEHLHSLTHENGYNITVGGTGGNTVEWTEEKRAVHSDILKKIPRTKQWLENMSKSQKGRVINHNSVERAKATKIINGNTVHILSYDCNGNFIKEYNSISEAARDIDCLDVAISETAKGRNHHYRKNMYWFRKEDIDTTDVLKIIKEHNDSKMKANNKPIPVDQYTLDYKYIKTWGSATEASKYFNKKSSGTICKCCKGKIKYAYGYIWKYHNEK